MKKQHLFANFFIIFSIFFLNFRQKSWTDHFCHFQRDENTFRVRVFPSPNPKLRSGFVFSSSPNPRMRSGFVFSFPVNPKLCFGFVFFDCLRIKTNPERNLERTHATETNPERNLERIHATETNPERIFINKKRPVHQHRSLLPPTFRRGSPAALSGSGKLARVSSYRPIWEPSPKFTFF